MSQHLDLQYAEVDGYHRELAGSSSLRRIRLSIYPFCADDIWNIFQVDFESWCVRIWGVGQEDEIVADIVSSSFGCLDPRSTADVGPLYGQKSFVNHIATMEERTTATTVLGTPVLTFSFVQLSRDPDDAGLERMMSISWTLAHVHTKKVTVSVTTTICCGMKIQCLALCDSQVEEILGLSSQCESSSPTQQLDIDKVGIPIERGTPKQCWH